jgi:hypothetical protein
MGRLIPARETIAPVNAKHVVPPPVGAKMPPLRGELADNDLQQVIGGLARTWVDDDVLSDRRDLAPADRK